MAAAAGICIAVLLLYQPRAGARLLGLQDHGARSGIGALTTDNSVLVHAKRRCSLAYKQSVLLGTATYFALCDSWPVLQRLGDVRGTNPLHSGQIGEGAGQLEHPVVGELLMRDTRYFEVDVDAVEQGSADPLPVAADRPRGTGAGAAYGLKAARQGSLMDPASVSCTGCRSEPRAALRAGTDAGGLGHSVCNVWAECRYRQLQNAAPQMRTAPVMFRIYDAAEGAATANGGA
jgi:hypothetical protein